MATDAPADVLRALGYGGAADALEDRRGSVVRGVPHRITYRTDLGELRVYRKLRSTRPRDAEAEWSALRALPTLGVRVPQAVCFARRGRHTAIVTVAAPGVAIHELLTSEPLTAGARRYLLERVAPALRRLHQAGVVHRDMYWFHWFAERLDPAAGEPVLIDVERAFRPRLRWRRWVVKDLAGLLSSWPPHVAGGTLGLRFLRVYLGGELDAGWKRLARDVLHKAVRIARHRPRWD